MTDQAPRPPELPPHAQQPYTQQPYTLQPNAYRSPTRPPLTQRAKKGTFWAGAVGFNLLTLGFYLALIPLVAAFFGAFFSLIVDLAGRSGRESAAGLDSMRHFFDTLDYGFLTILGVALVVVGLLLMAAGLFASAAILKSREIRRPWAVTWAGAGIAIVGYWFVGWILPFVFQLVSLVLVAAGADAIVVAVSQGALALVGLFAGNAVIGWLSWWWMAHVLRSGADAAPTNAARTSAALTNEGQE